MHPQRMRAEKPTTQEGIGREELQRQNRRRRRMRLTTYLMKLIQTNSGASSKAFFLVSVTIIGCLLLLTIGFVLLYEVLTTNTIHTDLMGIAAVIGAIGSLFATAGITKAFGERNEPTSPGNKQSKTEE